MIQPTGRGRPRKEKVRVEELRIMINKVVIRNFKSIRSLELDLMPGVNVLVGQNGSGKTNILEAIYFLYKSLIEAPSRVPYMSHAPEYWSGKDLIFNRDPSRHVELGFGLEEYTRSTGTNCKRWMKSTLEYRAMYSYEPARDTLVPIEHKYILNNNTIIILDSNKVVVEVQGELAKRLIKAKNIVEQLEKHGYKKTKRGESPALVLVKEAELAERPVLPLRPFILVTRALNRARRLALVEMVALRGGSGEVVNALVPVWAYEKCLGRARGHRVYPKRENESVNLFRGRATFPTIVHISLLIPDLISYFTLLKHPDIGAVSEPRRFEGRTRIDPRAKNLADVFLTLRGRKGGRLEILEDLISRGFLGYSIRVESSHGRVFLIAEEDGLELPPPNMPDGLIKLAAIGLALESFPSIMLIDEIENSMHAALLEIVFDALNSRDIPVLVATHSPLMIDLAGPDRIILVRRTGEGTVAERIPEPRRLSDVLEREGIVLSDYVIQSLTRGS